MTEEVLAQRRYYAETATCYDEMHVAERDEHYFALSWLSALIGHFGHESVLDIGSGTGRALLYLKARHPLRAVGIEPVGALRKKGHDKGLRTQELVDGDALSLPFADDTFDVVCAFAVLHHIREHGKAVAEMCRVARRGVFISDANNFGQGRFGLRVVKQALRACGFWRTADWILTGGRGFHVSDGDGIYYSYSLINDLPLIRQKFPIMHHLNTVNSGPNLYRTAPHLAVYAWR